MEPQSLGMTPETIGTLYFIKTYFLVFLAALFGGVAHALQKVKHAGWKGWVSFVSDIVVCVFFGTVFYQLGLMVKPESAVIMTSLGSYWGAKSFEFLKDWVIIGLKANLK